MLLLCYFWTQIDKLRTVIGLDIYQDDQESFESKYGEYIVDFKTNDTLSSDKLFSGYNDGKFPLIFWSRNIKCDDLGMSYAFRDIFSGDKIALDPPGVKYGPLDCHHNNFWNGSVYSLPFDSQNLVY